MRMEEQVWRDGGEALRLRSLEEENRRLKHLATDLSLDKEALKPIVGKKGELAGSRADAALVMEQSERCPDEDCQLARGVQRRATARQFGLSHAQRVRRNAEILTSIFMRKARQISVTKSALCIFGLCWLE